MGWRKCSGENCSKLSAAAGVQHFGGARTRQSFAATRDGTIRRAPNRHSGGNLASEDRRGRPRGIAEQAGRARRFSPEKGGTSWVGRQRQRRGRRGAHGNFALGRWNRLVPREGPKHFSRRLEAGWREGTHVRQRNPQLWAERGVGNRDGQRAERQGPQAG